MHAMLSPILLALAIQQISAQLVARATLNGTAGVTATFTFTEIPGQGTQIEGTISGLATNTSTVYPYHLHAAALAPLGASGFPNCSTALGHLDPLSVSDGLNCGPSDASLHWHCQEGDLSGKHGRINGTESGEASVSYTDPYVRWSPQPFSILGRSIVIHSSNGSRLACGNITSEADGTADVEGNPTFNSSSYQNAYPSAAPPPPAATLAPFVGTSTVSSLYSQMFIAASLPAVGETSNIALSTSIVPTSTINGTTFTSLTIPFAIAAPITSGSASASGTNAAATLPTQMPVTAPLAPTQAAANAASSGASGSPSASRGGAQPTGLPLIQGVAGGLAAAALGVVALL